MRVAGEVARGAQAIVVDQFAVALGEVPAAALRQLVGCRRQIVGAVFDRHTAETPEGGLHACAQCLKTLARANRHRLPVRVRQHEVIQQMRERLAGDDHFELAHVRKIRLPLFSGHMRLRKEHLAVRPRLQTPRQEPPLQRAQLPGAEPPGVAPVHLLPHGLGLKSAILLQQRLDLRPHIGKRIRPAFATCAAPSPPRGSHRLAHICAPSARSYRLLPPRSPGIILALTMT